MNEDVQEEILVHQIPEVSICQRQYSDNLRRYHFYVVCINIDMTVLGISWWCHWNFPFAWFFRLH